MLYSRYKYIRWNLNFYHIGYSSVMSELGPIDRRAEHIISKVQFFP